MLFVCFLVLGLGIHGWAADIYVSPAGGGSGTIGSPTDLQTALDMARVNAENDTIYLQTGTYDASAATGASAFDYGATSNDNMAVTLSGGWNTGFTMQSDDPSLTLLDGGGDSRVLNILADTTGVSITFTLENLTIQNGYHATAGGGIYSYTGTEGSSGSINLTVDNCDIQHCDAGGGAGIWSNGYFQIYDCVFDDNVAVGSGGAIMINDVPGGDHSLAPKIERTDFTANSSGGGGNGSAFFSYMSPVVDKCLFDGNYGAGSPILSHSSFITVSDSIFKNNDIIYWGGGLHFWSSGGKVTNCLFYDNIAGHPLAGNATLTYYNGGSGTDTIDITNCTFEDNEGDITTPRSDAIHNRGATMNITNSIFWNNMGTAGLYNGFGGGGVLGSINLSYCDLQGGVPSGCVDAGNNINLDPNFASATDHHLTTGSPCIDVGNNSATYLPTKDLDGEDRMIDGDRNGSAIVDMGVYEYNPSPVPDLTANGSDGPITIAEGDSLEILLSLDAVDYGGENADWWVLKKTSDPAPNNWFYFDLPTKTWTAGRFPTRQGTLFDIAPRKVPKTSGLTPGTYKFYFAVDMNMDGKITLAEIFYDMVKVIITP